MRKLFLLIGLIASLTINAQTIELPRDKENNIIYTGIVIIDSVPQSELYSRAREWFTTTFLSSKDVIQMDNKEKIIGKAALETFTKNLGVTASTGYMNYTFSVYLKDGKYKYMINNFHSDDFGKIEDMYNTTRPSKNYYQKIFNQAISQVNDNMEGLIISLNEAMKNKISDTSNW